MRGKITSILGLAIFLVGCAPVQMRSQVDRPAGESYASTGDIVLRVNRMDDLPNVFGRADLFGRTRDRGFTEVRYMGLNASGMPVFRRRDVDIMTDETTMSRTGSFSTFQAHGAAQQVGRVGGAQYNAVATSYSAPTANIDALPPDTVEFTLDLKQSRVVTIGQNGFEVIDANPAGLKFRAY
jgi:hypothetical protein